MVSGKRTRLIEKKDTKQKNRTDNCNIRNMIRTIHITRGNTYDCGITVDK